MNCIRRISVMIVFIAGITHSAYLFAADEVQQNLVRVMVSEPSLEVEDFRLIGNVFTSSMIRELNREGGMEIVRTDQVKDYMSENGFKGSISDRDTALEVGQGLDADIVIFSFISKRYDDFVYRIVLLDVNRDVVQRIVDGEFKITASPNVIGRMMNEQTPKLVRYIPKQAEIIDPGYALRQITVNPEQLPPQSVIADLPPLDSFGYIEQVFSYFNVFPGQLEYRKFNQQEMITRFSTSQDLDEKLRTQINQYYMTGDFAIRYGLQAYLIKNCSVRTINTLLANKIPVFINGMVLTGYQGMTLDGYSVLQTIDGQYIESYDLTHRDRMAVMFMVPKPGQYRGISREYLDMAVGYYPDEWGELPELVEIKESFLDIAPAGWE